MWWEGVRKKELFRCNGPEMNVDVNGAWNIFKWALGKPGIRSILGAGASVAMSELPSNDPASVKQAG
ncbi:MAG: IS605 OrfB-like transposable element containing RNAse H-like and Zn finger domain [Candidatus Methanohalarchaeum thermophilum]|uniref:IS605 OrfB-like transposable element containing RNAse H-like and Zn finger domain n=1 Tax=Methanohalarchaeum thermophilum TaxID=1903181 RepID=A0A1Q6DW38_METT1|nr:MAG: IS605 OrfB-like transposable element containing RNAse H-like and Zn finger domain [Candidatus Methanohalarchaeum thermophilum]